MRKPPRIAGRTSKKTWSVPGFSIECQEDIAGALPAHRVRFERFAGCGHGVVADAPERAMAVIREFIGS